MHMWNCFTVVRAGAHISICISTELEFYHLFVLKGKKKQTQSKPNHHQRNLVLLHRGRNLSKASFPLAGLGYSSSTPTHAAEPSSWSARESGGNETHMSASPSCPSSLAKTLFCFSHKPPQDQKRCQGGGYFLYLFSDKLHSKVVLPQPEEILERQCSRSSQHGVFPPQFRALSYTGKSLNVTNLILKLMISNIENSLKKMMPVWLSKC